MSAAHIKTWQERIVGRMTAGMNMQLQVNNQAMQAEIAELRSALESGNPTPLPVGGALDAERPDEPKKLALWNQSCGSANAYWYGSGMHEAGKAWRKLMAEGQRTCLTKFGCGVVATEEEMEWKFGEPKGSFERDNGEMFNRWQEITLRICSQPTVDEARAQQAGAGQTVAVPAGWREFLTDCAGAAGGMVSGNRLSDRAAVLLSGAPVQETEACEGCNGYGLVGNILDTDTCPFCKGNGEQAIAGLVESAPASVADKVDAAARYNFLRLGPPEGLHLEDGSVWVVKYKHAPGTIPELASAGFGETLDIVIDAAILAAKAKP